MTQLSDATKVAKVNEAFGAAAQEYVKEGNNKKALALIHALDSLSADSKLTLFNILTK